MASIQDNGIGFVPNNKTIVNGFGIEGMIKRSHEAGLTITWEENIGGGTIVNISPTTN
jgi:signal transduction histidine kinase